jgi:hypothetical protein
VDYSGLWTLRKRMVSPPQVGPDRPRGERLLRAGVSLSSHSPPHRPMDDDIRTYELRFLGGGPGMDMPDGGAFDTQSALIEHLDKVEQSDYGPLAMGDAEVWVYQGGDIDITTGFNTVIGKIDAHIAQLQGEFEEEDLSEPDF